MLVADGEGAAECYSVATKRDQAAKVFKAACNMRAQSPEIAALTKKRRTDIYVPDTFSFFNPLGANANTLDGLNAHLVIKVGRPLGRPILPCGAKRGRPN